MYKNKISSILNDYDDDIHSNEEDFIVPQQHQNNSKNLNQKFTQNKNFLKLNISLDSGNSSNISPNSSPTSQSLNFQSLSPLGLLANQALLDFNQQPLNNDKNCNSQTNNNSKQINIKNLNQIQNDINRNQCNLIESPKVSPRIIQYNSNINSINTINSNSNNNNNIVYHSNHLNIPTTITSKLNETVHYKYSKFKRETYQFEQIPLFIACFHNNINSLKTMIKFGTDMNYQCKNRGWTPLMFASQEGNLEILLLILSVKNVDINIKNHSGDTALMIACYNSRKEIVENLLLYRADCNLSNGEGTTPLMVSSALGDFEIMNLLIKSKSNVNMVDNRGYPALMYSQLYGVRPTQTDQRLEENEMDHRVMSINILLSAGSRIDHVSKDEFDPLKLSIKHGPFNFVHYLLDHLVDVSVLFLLDSQSWSPLKLAMRYSSFSVLLLVFKKIHVLIQQDQQQQQQHHHHHYYQNQQQQLSQNSSSITITNKYQFLFECLVFLIQCQRDIDIFIKVIDYFFQVYQFRLDIPKIEILIESCRESSNISIEDYLVSQHQHLFQYLHQQQQQQLSQSPNYHHQYPQLFTRKKNL